MGEMEFYLYFCLVLVDYLILFGVEIVSGLVLLLRLQMVLGSIMRRIVCDVVYREPSSYSFPTYGIADRRFVITVAPACQLENAEHNTWHMTRNSLPIHSTAVFCTLTLTCLLLLSVLYFISHIWFRRTLTSGAGGGTHFEPSPPLLPGVKTFLQSQHKDSNFFLSVELRADSGSLSPHQAFSITMTGYTTLCRTPLDE